MTRSTGGKGWSLVSACPHCGKPGADCRCAAAARARLAGPPVVRLRLEKRRGKPVTVAACEGIAPDDLKRLLKELKTLLATGGTVRPGLLELQGDHRDRLRRELAARNLSTKG